MIEGIAAEVKVPDGAPFKPGSPDIALFAGWGGSRTLA